MDAPAHPGVVRSVPEPGDGDDRGAHRDAEGDDPPGEPCKVFSSPERGPSGTTLHETPPPASWSPVRWTRGAPGRVASAGRDDPVLHHEGRARRPVSQVDLSTLASSPRHASPTEDSTTAWLRSLTLDDRNGARSSHRGDSVSGAGHDMQWTVSGTRSYPAVIRASSGSPHDQVRFAVRWRAQPGSRAGPSPPS